MERKTLSNAKSRASAKPRIITMQRLYEFTRDINLEAERDAFIIRFNDLMPETRGKFAKLLKKGSSIHAVNKESGPSIQTINNILTRNNPILWEKFEYHRGKNNLGNYPLYRWREIMLSRIIFYATKETALTANQRSNIKPSIVTPFHLRTLHEIRRGQRQHDQENCEIYNCPFCEEHNEERIRLAEPNEIGNAFLASSARIIERQREDEDAAILNGLARSMNNNS